MLGRVAGSTLLLWLGPKELAFGAELLAVRVWPANDYTRVTLESDTPLNATFFSIPNPNRLVIDIEGLDLSARLKELVSKVRQDDPYIAGVRVGQNRPKVVRLVVDLKQPIKPQVFGLPPVAAYHHRLVFDLYPSIVSDPTLALQAPLPPAASASVPSAPDAASTPPAPTAAASGGSPGAYMSAPGASAPPAIASGPDITGQNAKQAAQAMNDALGDFIQGLKDAPAAPGTPGKAATSPRLADKGGDKGNDKTDVSPPPLGDATAPAKRLVIVAIDAGHGGEDPGATGPSGLHEKDVVLEVAQKLRALINAQPGMRAMLTRESDYFVPLHERVVKARRVQADLFVSIHADAFMNAAARGASVFALSEHGATSAAARWMAKKENASDLIGGVNIKAKDATVMRAMLDMSTAAQIKDSLKLGAAVLGHLGKVGRLHKSHVEQAGFAVLKAPDIPSILVETGFISNPEEESKLQEDGYQDKLAAALLSGIQRYFARNPPLARNRAL
jgi:N-acetylmuramoyl-L-alanine amidase